jgi:hypothetical protein
MASESLFGCRGLARLVHADRQHLAQGTGVPRSRFLGCNRNVLRENRSQLHQSNERISMARAAATVEKALQFRSPIGEIKRNGATDSDVCV